MKVSGVGVQVSAIKKIQITNHNDRNSKSQTIGFCFHLRFGYCNLEFICPILRSGGACNLLFPVYPGLLPLTAILVSK